MSEPNKGSDVRTLAVRISPDFHAQLSMVAQVDGISLTDLMMAAPHNHVAARREAPDFQAKAQAALEEAEAQMARTRAMLLGAGEGNSVADSTVALEPAATGRGRRNKDEATG